MHINEVKSPAVQTILVSALNTWTFRFSILFYLCLTDPAQRRELVEANMAWNLWLIVHVSMDLTLALANTSVVAWPKSAFGDGGESALLPMLLAVFEETACPTK